MQSYSLNTSDHAVLARRVCMIAVLGSRTAISIVGILYNFFTLRLVSVILGSILAVIGFLFVGWCLAKIGEAEGVRLVMGSRVVCFFQSCHSTGTSLPKLSSVKCIQTCVQRLHSGARKS
jgi:hypothetical protein